MEGGGDGTSLSHAHVTCPLPFCPPPPPSPPLAAGLETASDTIQPLGLPEAASASNDVFSSTPKNALSDDLRDQIVRQVEYYFSDENLSTDKFLLKFVKKDKGFVPIAVIASFRKMKKLVQDNSLIEAALQTSTQLVVSSDGNKVKRLHPLSNANIKDVKACTVLVENLPEDYSMESIHRVFGDIGTLKNVCIRDPCAPQESKRATKGDLAISSKLHALVEYETVEAAEKAVATLNDEKNWRSGMRVELLLKRMGKYGLAARSRKGTVSEKNSCALASDTFKDEQNPVIPDHRGEMHEEEQEGHVLGDKGGRQAKNRGRGTSHRHHKHNGLGHGAVASGAGHESVSKPPPGPKMPDGTRGFTMGRGRLLVSRDTS